MFSDFDFSLLADPDFKEDSVREELILPLIKALGYSPGGDSRIIRSKSLIHPYVAIGSKQRKVSIIPDYVFLSKNKPYWVLDAKSPSEDIVKSQHVEQAYSYAIHPEIRADLYALCNGKEFVLYETRKFEPIMRFKLSDIEKHWDILFRILNPDIKANTAVLEYDLDYGVYLRRGGVAKDMKFIATAVHSAFIAKVEDNCYTTLTVIPGDIKMMVSLYFNEAQYQKLLSLTTPSIRSKLLHGLRGMPYYVSLENEEILFGVSSTLSNQVLSNSEESYIPFIVDDFLPYMGLPIA